MLAQREYYMPTESEVPYMKCMRRNCFARIALMARFMCEKTDLEFGSSAGVIFLMEADI